MNLAPLSEAQVARLQPAPHKVILITGGSPEFKFAEDIREEIRAFGWVCEIFYGDASDQAQVRKLVRDALDCFHHAGAPVNNDETGSCRVPRAITDEEWLAQ